MAETEPPEEIKTCGEKVMRGNVTFSCRIDARSKHARHSWGDENEFGTFEFSWTLKEQN